MNKVLFWVNKVTGQQKALSINMMEVIFYVFLIAKYPFYIKVLNQYFYFYLYLFFYTRLCTTTTINYNNNSIELGPPAVTERSPKNKQGKKRPSLKSKSSF